MRKNNMWVVNILMLFGLIGLFVTIFNKISAYFTANPVGTVIAVIIFLGGLKIIKNLLGKK